MTDPKHTEPVVVVTSNDSMCGGLYPVHGSVTHGRTVECCDFCGLPADYEPARTAAEAASRAREARLREALAKARKIIRDVEDYMARPDRGDWGTECALCMGELFDDDREAIAAIDAALTASEGGEA